MQDSGINGAEHIGLSIEDKGKLPSQETINH